MGTSADPRSDAFRNLGMTDEAAARAASLSRWYRYRDTGVDMTTVEHVRIGIMRGWMELRQDPLNLARMLVLDRPAAREAFRLAWLNLCRALVAVSSRIALDQRLVPRTEEELACMALADRLTLPDRYGVFEARWSPWRSELIDSPDAILVCRFCQEPLRDSRSHAFIRKSHLVDERERQIAAFHWKSCALKYWANEVCKP